MSLLVDMRMIEMTALSKKILTILLVIFVVSGYVSEAFPGQEQAESVKVEYKGFWQPRLGRIIELSKEPEWLVSVGANTITIQASYIPQDDGTFKVHKEWMERMIITSVKRFHAAGIKVFLVVTPWVPWAKPGRSREKEYLRNYESAVLHWAAISEKLGIEMFSPANEPDNVFSASAVSDWHQRILPVIREIYGGIVVAKMKDAVNCDYRGFDFIGISMISQLSEGVIKHGVAQAQRYAVRDKVRGVIISEFSLAAKGPKPREAALSSYLESVFEASHGKVYGYFVGIPRWEVRGHSAEDTVKKYFSEGN